ncbi:DNA internalization-related competence protein ComEC/Rec2 [Pseudonocardia hispaniensis]|uniref:DNA internalization-related competence protein ComEC/Rec2 n=1 Tax=Pseudonocardia hispaniensis TaxID=904933 RepID=A0ABW1J7N0_9PSEU
MVLLGLLAGPVAAGTVTGVAAVVAAAAWTRRHRWSAAVLAAVGAAAAAGVVVSTHTVLIQGHPLAVAAERGTSAVLRLELSDDPRPLRGAGYGSRPGGVTQVLVPAELRGAQVGDATWATAGRVLVLAPPQGWAGLLPGQQLTAEGRLAPAQRRDLTVAVLRVDGPPREVGPPSWWQGAAGLLRDGLRDAARVLPEGSAGLLPGLAIGDTRGMQAEVQEDFRVAGLTHLTAVSGANLAIIGGAVLGLLRLLRTDPRFAAVCAGAAILGFVVLARPSPSVLRAAVMGGVVLLALALGRRRSAVPALAVAVLALLLADPRLAIDPGFALSALATAALVLVAPGWAGALRRRGVPPGAAEALVVPAAAGLATAPLIAGLSGEVSLVSVVANLLVVPAVAPATVLGVLAAVLSPLSGPLATGCAWLSGPAVGWLVAVADRAAAVPGAVVAWPAGWGGALLLAGALLATIALGRSPRRRAVLLAVLLGLLLVLVPARIAPPGWPPAGWAVVACDVGQGDALVLATGHPGRAVLIDTGPEGGPVDDCLRRLGIHALDLVILSHLHADHVGGLAGALRGRATGAVAVGPSRQPRWALEQVSRHSAAAGAPLVGLAAGQRLVWPALTLEVIGPVHPADRVDPDDGTAVNDGSLVARAATAAGTVLLTGDIELSGQADLLDAGVPLRADVLKMPHHGSRYSSAAFLSAVAPRVALVSVGAGNTYRHPSPHLMNALTEAGVAVRRTDLAGDTAVIVGDGPGPPELALVSRGDPLPARRRRRLTRVMEPRRPRACRFRASRSHEVGDGGSAARVVVSRAGPGPRGRPCWWRVRSRSGRPDRSPRRGS